MAPTIVKVAALIAGIGLGGIGLSNLIQIASAESTDYRQFKTNCVDATETFNRDFFQFFVTPEKIRLIKCTSKPEIEMQKLNSDGTIDYTMYAVPEACGAYEPIDKNFTITKIEIGRRTYTRETGPQELFDKATKNWKEYWARADCDEILENWDEWKINKKISWLKEKLNQQEEKERLKRINEEKKQYGDTIDNLLRKLD